jgi:hypothetical protein
MRILLNAPKWLIMADETHRRPSHEVVSDWLLGNGISWEREWGREDVHAVTQLTSSHILQPASVQIMSDDLKAWSPRNSVSIVHFINNVI